MSQSINNISVITFYHFFNIENCEQLRNKLKPFLVENSVLGTIILAEEGINGTISVSMENSKKVMEYISCTSNVDIFFKESKSTFHPFSKLKLKIKNEVVTVRTPERVVVNNTGKHLSSDEWDNLLEDPNTILIDTRNVYETVMGYFENAILPPINNFTEFFTWLDQNITEKDKDKNIAMYCTGGVRCEKCTTYLKNKGFKNIFHLQDGIIKYIEDRMSSGKSKWIGDMFVFDDRIALKGNLSALYVK